MDGSLEDGLLSSYETILELAEGGDPSALRALELVNWERDITSTLYPLPDDPDDMTGFITRFSDAISVLVWARLVAYVRREGSAPTHMQFDGEFGFDRL